MQAPESEKISKEGRIKLFVSHTFAMDPHLHEHPNPYTTLGHSLSQYTEPNFTLVQYNEPNQTLS